MIFSNVKADNGSACVSHVVELGPELTTHGHLQFFFKGVALKSQTWAEILHFGYQNFGPLIFILYDPISIEQLEADINR